VDAKLEVVVLPVADVDRAKAFYQGLGWRPDADVVPDERYRVVQFTPPGSPASIQFGTGITTMPPGSVQSLMLIVADIAAARAELISHGADVSEIWHGAGLFADLRVPGPDPGHGSYRSFATFADPDGNSWLLQELTERLPGREWPTDVAALADLLHETADHHGAFEAVAPPHDWWDWYAVYLDARQHGSTPEVASAAAGRYMAEVKHIVA
jgi:catechol 2,3-dioxygenase-like lactoylglutathione lyase family enzyme